MSFRIHTPTIERLPNLLHGLYSGHFSIPPFQRHIVWDVKQRLALCDSIRLGLPTGALMIWTTTKQLDPRGFEGPFNLRPLEDPRSSPSRYLLDGLQRLTTLFAALGAGFWTAKGEEPPYQTKKSPDGSPWAIYFDVSKDDGAFMALEADHKDYLPLRVLLDDQAYDDWREDHAPSREVKNRARILRSAFVDYQFPVLPLSTDDISVVTETFKRVNTGGTKMGQFDMTRALSWRDDFDLEARIEDLIMPALEPLGWREVERDDLLRIIRVGYGQSLTEQDADKLSFGIRAEPRRFDKITETFSAAVRFLSEMGISGPALLPYGHILTFTFRAFYEAQDALDSSQRADLRRWVAESSIGGRFSAGVTTAMINASWNELARALNLPNAPDTERSKADTLKLKPCGRINASWARPKVSAIVLGCQKPLDAEGRTPPNLPGRLGAQGVYLLQRLLPGSASVAFSQLENRILCEPEALEALRARLKQADCPLDILSSHVISPQAHSRLVAGEQGAFLAQRALDLVARENAWLKEMRSDLQIST